MTLTVASYNIQYGYGIDGRYNLERICNSVREADIILLQEVTRGLPRNGGVDMVAAIEAEFRDRYCADHMPTDIDLGSTIGSDGVRKYRYQFGNMVLSRWPLLATRGHLLPRVRRSARLNLQRGALEALIETPLGPMRFMSVHLDHVDADERLRQIGAIREIMTDMEGPGASGLGEFGFPELPVTGDMLVMGDFNLKPDSPEHDAMIAGGVAVDVSPPGEVMSFYNPAETDALQRLDYGFASPGLAGRVTRSWIDEDAVGSDHRPLWVELS